jgi:hypothetical protein
MDLTNIFQNLFQGNNPVLLLLALFLFKDQIFALFTPKPKPGDPVVVPPPVVLPVTPEERPLVDALVKLLPIILPVIIDQISKQKQEQPK